jgi:hypothetical protein
MGIAAMNRVAAITGQINAIAERITGAESYSLTSLCEVRNAILDEQGFIASEIIKRDASNDYRAKHDGSDAPITNLTLKLPVQLRALGNEVRRLQDYFARGLISQEEADERLADWGLNNYPPGWVGIEILADLRRWGGV